MTKPIDFNRPVTTRDGRTVKVLTTTANHNMYPVVALVTDENGEEHAEVFTANGKFYSSEEDNPDPDDLVNLPIRSEQYINVYIRPNDNGVRVTDGYFSQGHAEDCRMKVCGATTMRLNIVDGLIESVSIVSQVTSE